MVHRLQRELMEGMNEQGLFVYRYPNNSDIYRLLELEGLMESKTRIGDLGRSFRCGSVLLHVFSKDAAIAKAKREGKRFVHRVYVDCDCDKLVPYGRLHQHRCR